jgi:hypothetical protein
MAARGMAAAAARLADRVRNLRRSNVAMTYFLTISRAGSTLEEELLIWPIPIALANRIANMGAVPFEIPKIEPWDGRQAV